jgi:hypothetical protein
MEHSSLPQPQLRLHKHLWRHFMMHLVRNSGPPNRCRVQKLSITHIQRRKNGLSGAILSTRQVCRVPFSGYMGVQQVISSPTKVSTSWLLPQICQHLVSRRRRRMGPPLALPKNPSRSQHSQHKSNRLHQCRHQKYIIQAPILSDT